MTDNIEHIDVDSDEYQDAPKALRDAYKKLQARYGEVAQERDTYRGQATTQALSGALTGFKNPERVKSALLTDKVDPLDSEAVKTWLETNGDDYARAEGTPAPQAHQQEAQELDRMNSVEVRSPADMTRFEAAQAEITPDMTGADIKALYRKHGL